MMASVGRAGGGDRAGRGESLALLSPWPLLSLWASLCRKLCSAGFVLRMRDYTDKPDGEGGVEAGREGMGLDAEVSLGAVMTSELLTLRRTS